MSIDSDVDDSESSVTHQLVERKRLSFLNLCMVTVLVIFAIVSVSHYVLKSRRIAEENQRTMLQMKDLDQFAQRYLEILLPDPLPASLSKGGRENAISGGVGQPDQIRHVIMEFQVLLQTNDSVSYYNNNLLAQFDFVFNDGQWILLDKPIFNPERFLEEAAREFERKWFAENQDVRSLAAHLETHKAEAFKAAMRTNPMTPPGGKQ